MPGAFVLGSNDYYSPTLKNPLRYLVGTPGSRTQDRPIDLPWGDLVSGLRGGGLGRPDQRARRPWRSRAYGSRCAGSTTRTSDVTTTRGRPDPTSRTTPTSPWVSSTRPTTGSPTRWPPTACRWSSPGTRTAGRSASRSTAPSSPTATSARAGPRDSAGTRTRPWLHVSAGLGHLAVRPDPVRLPARGDPAHPRPGGAGGLSAGRRRFGRPARGGLSSACFGVWRSLVARFVRDEEVVGSNPATPTSRPVSLQVRDTGRGRPRRPARAGRGARRSQEPVWPGP